MNACIAGFIFGLVLGGPLGFTTAAVIIAGRDRWED